MHRLLFFEAETHHPRDIVDRDRLKARLASARQWKNPRRKLDQPAEDIHELVFGPEDDRRSQHSPSQAAGLYRILGYSLAVQEGIRRPAVSAILRHEDDALHTLHSRGGDETLRRGGVGVGVLLVFPLDRDRRQVNDGTASIE